MQFSRWSHVTLALANELNGRMADLFSDLLPWQCNGQRQCNIQKAGLKWLTMLSISM